MGEDDEIDGLLKKALMLLIDKLEKEK